ncbi:pentapeptide repeat-containing protein [Actinomadura sp. 9N407]|uniref:pentapeptide repeat-containing protein n=1 Tax=Actinomadura sp. 9N407 TaxID=3375154 RepID=UPI00379E0696
MTARVRHGAESVRRRWRKGRIRVRQRVRRRGWSLAALFWMATAAAAAAAAIWFTTGWLLDTTGRVLDRDPKATGADRARVKVEAVRTGLAAGAGAGAAVGLMLAFRRQAHAEHDTAQTRLTELYNAAAEQLGSDKAPVRLTALYTLERLANDNPRHQQTIVNIICAYLRMPYTPPPRPDDADDGEDERAQREQARRHTIRYRSARAGQPAPLEPADPPAPDPHEELQVRLTAQRLLTTHLHRDASLRWRGIALDLTGATLTDLDLNLCSIDRADFTGATFAGDAGFNGVSFAGPAQFAGASFAGTLEFEGASFAGGAGFEGASFAGHAWFGMASFVGGAGFEKASFAGGAAFEGASFAGHAWFGMASFADGARFEGASFAGHAAFYGASFAGDARFGGASFAGRVEFAWATVAEAGGEHVLPAGWRIELAEGGTGRVVPDQAESET